MGLDGPDALSLLPLIALMIGALVTALSVALLFAVALRKRRHTDAGGSHGEKSKPANGEPQVMDINHDHYVVSYTLKSMNEQPKQRQPDILTARYGTALGTASLFLDAGFLVP